MEISQLEFIIEAAIFASGEPINLERLRSLFDAEERPTNKQLKEALKNIEAYYERRGIHLVEVASGYCFQTDIPLQLWIKKLWPEKQIRYSRAFIETLAVIAYRQPVTRAEIEELRGVTVSSSIFKNLLEHEWIKIIGQREVPGRPSLYATTDQFLNHFNIKSIEQLPSLESLSTMIKPEIEKQKENRELALEASEPSLYD